MIQPLADGTLWPSHVWAPREPTDQRKLAEHHFHLIDIDAPEAMALLFEPDAVYIRPGYEPFLGRAEILRFYTQMRVIREGQHTLETVIASDRQLAVRGAFSGSLHDGSPIELRFSDFFTLGDTGRFSRRETFFSTPLT